MTQTANLHHIARSRFALFRLENHGVISLRGRDALDYLHRISTADLKALPLGAAVQTLFLGGDGRLIADAVAFILSPDHIMLLCHPLCRTALLQQLEKLLFTEDVQITDLSDQRTVGMAAGPVASDFLERLGFEPALESGRCSILNDGEIAAGMVALAPGAPRVFFFGPSEWFSSRNEEICAAKEEMGGIGGEDELSQILRIEDGIPEFGKELTERTIPLEAGMKSAISFTKGCFPGQEVVARIENLGHPANILTGLKLPDGAGELAGQQLFLDDKLVGRVTSSCVSPSLGQTLGMGYVKHDLREPGRLLKLGSADSAITAETISLPL